MKTKFHLRQLLLIVTVFAAVLAIFGKWYRESLNTEVTIESSVSGIEVWSSGACIGKTPLQFQVPSTFSRNIFYWRSGETVHLCGDTLTQLDNSGNIIWEYQLRIPQAVKDRLLAQSLHSDEHSKVIVWFNSFARMPSREYYRSQVVIRHLDPTETRLREVENLPSNGD